VVWIGEVGVVVTVGAALGCRTGSQQVTKVSPAKDQSPEC
jgi:hypothetical protein